MKQQIEDDERTIIPDGGVVRVSLFQMDGKPRAPIARKPFTGQHRPGAQVLTDAERQARTARLAAKNKVLSERWKKTGAKA